ncbi:MarR family winged helix-turn-helix transcriptional regulator [Agromyces sp. SYSU T00194]|uniref:MarR family winged helix-turn-helix transcriptional regulator n=1 Tax=Agromyces chitinivorans TaxID=3158560 RepID=UPI00339AA64B
MDDPGGSGEIGARALVLAARITGHLNAVSPPAIAGSPASNLTHRILVQLDANPAGIAPSVLAELLEVDRSVISRALADLDRHRIVTRRVEAHDRRYVRVRLSARGRREMATYSESIRSVLPVIAPLADELLTIVGDEGSDAPTPVTPAIAADRLAAYGVGVVPRLVEEERERGVTHWSQRFALWVVCDLRSTSPARIAELLLLPRDTIEVALAALEERELVEPVGASEPTFRATDRGNALTAAHADIVLDPRGGLRAALASVHAAAAMPA